MIIKQHEIFKAIDDILYYDWDPIGICNLAPRNEYQNYSAEIFDLFIGGAEIETIAEKLYEIETSEIGVTGSIDHCKKIAYKIVNLR